MHAQIGNGPAPQARPNAPQGPASAPAEAAAPAPAPGPLVARRAQAGSLRPLRPGPGRETSQPPSVPRAAALSSAAQACCAAAPAVLTLFNAAANGEPPPLAVAEEAAQRLLQAVEQEQEAVLALVRLKAHVDYACMHSVAVCALMAAFAAHLKFDRAQREEAALAGLLHDIGKVFVPHRILSKPGRLTEEEYAVVREHPRQGYEMLCTMDGLQDAVRDVAQHHHERPDGRGYPHALRRNQISTLACMGALCDVYDAISSNRPYKDGWDPAAAVAALLQWAGEGQFDPTYAGAFQAMMGSYPVGSLVRLKSQRLAVVNAKSRHRGAGLSVTAFYCLQSQALIDPVVTDLTPSGPDMIVVTESNAVWRFQQLDRLWAGEAAAQMQGLKLPQPQARARMAPTSAASGSRPHTAAPSLVKRVAQNASNMAGGLRLPV